MAKLIDRYKSKMLYLSKDKFMDIQSEKYALIAFITQIKDVRLIEKLRDFVKANDKDFWHDLTEVQKKDVMEGIRELDKGKKIDYEDVMSKHR